MRRGMAGRGGAKDGSGGLHGRRDEFRRGK